MTHVAATEKRRRSDAIACVLLLVVVAAIFSRVLGFQYLDWDDYDLLLQNGLLRPATFDHLKLLWTAAYAGLYTPLSYSLWWLILKIHPLADAMIFHGVSFLLHLFCAAAVFSIVKKCVRSRTAAFAGAAVFALHPMQIESVAWISETNNLLSAALSLLAIRLYLQYAPAPKRWLYLAASAAFFLALLAKPTAVVVPLAAAVLVYYFFHRSPAAILRSLWPWFVGAIVFAVVAHHVQLASDIPALTFWKRPAIAADALSFYVYKLIWPVHLTIDYARTPAAVLQSDRWIAAVAAVIVAVALWPRLDRIRPGLLVMVVCLLPVLGLVAFDFQRYSTVADRFMYLPMLGVALVAATFPRPLAILIVLLLAFKTEMQLPIWHDTDALTAHTLALDPGSAIGNKIRGEERARKQDWPGATAAFSKALIRNPTDGDLHFNLANALRAQGEYEAAIDEYITSLALLDPDLRLRAMNNLGIAYFQAGDPDMAEAEFMQVLQIDPQNAEARKNLSQVFIGVPSQ